MEIEYHGELQTLQFVTHLSNLSQLVNELILPLYAPGKEVGISDLLIVIQSFQAWESSLPHFFQLSGPGSAHVLVMHMYYRMMLIQYVYLTDFPSQDHC